MRRSPRARKGGDEETPAAFPGRLDELLDLGRCQVLAGSQVGIGGPDRHDLPVYVTWIDQLQVRIHWEIPQGWSSDLRDNGH